MNTPTDDEIVAHLKQTYTGGVFLDEAIREALRLAREGLPVKDEDEAEVIWNEISGSLTYDTVIYTIRTFLAARDAERDAEIAELVKAASYARICLKNGGYHNEWTRNLDAVLAKMERKS